MLTEQQVAYYLRRIAYKGSLAVELSTLQALHQAHMLQVPFENLDIPLGRPIVITQQALYNKIVAARRGGFCYELNHLFFALLSTLGFKVQMLSACVVYGNSFGQPFDHMLLLVELDGKQYIADVGFGDSFREPLLLQDEPVTQRDAAYCFRREGSDYVLLQQKQKESMDWQPQYRFDLDAHGIEAFQPMCMYQQSSPDSPFTKKSVCSIATEDGRKTISNGRLILTAGGERTEHAIASEAEYRQILQADFGMSLVAGLSLRSLLPEKIPA
ncbi:arylamine N-acetyltransferase family protein [Undibacterium terreum]|uniref:Acetyltransferase n=1 Tax=Undibacterium terreum TaxID=1224302 RepID=A0A916UB80_9BURK|nr:arylamine N-acetyltransferase [Undibacterium terreum]GGC66135.1 acetyltransferase [Undibacterium terreum]